MVPPAGRGSGRRAPEARGEPRETSRWLLLPSGWRKALPPRPPGAARLRLLLLVAGPSRRRDFGGQGLAAAPASLAACCAPAHGLSLPGTRGVLPFPREVLPRLGTRDPEHWRSRLCLVSRGAPAAAPGPPAGSFVGAPQRVTLGQGGLVDGWVRPGCPLSPERQGARCPLGHTRALSESWSHFCARLGEGSCVHGWGEVPPEAAAGPASAHQGCPGGH